MILLLHFAHSIARSLCSFDNFLLLNITRSSEYCINKSGSYITLEVTYSLPTYLPALNWCLRLSTGNSLRYWSYCCSKLDRGRPDLILATQVSDADGWLNMFAIVAVDLNALKTLSFPCPIVLCITVDCLSSLRLLHMLHQNFVKVVLFTDTSCDL